MAEERNQFQITRKDAKNCFVESLSDAFDIGKIHLVFATYDTSKPVGQRQTNNIPIYITVDEFLELHRKVACGELRYIMQNKKKNADSTPLYQSLGGTSAERLAKQQRSRSDGMSQSRIVQLVCGSKVDFLLVAESGPGATNDKGLIVPKFGNKPESRVAVGMTFETFAELILTTHLHYSAWLSSFYMRKAIAEAKKKPSGTAEASFDNDNLPF